MSDSHIVWQQGRVDAAMRQALLAQKPHLFWFTGLSGAGKSTLAHGLEEYLHTQKRLSYVFDGDNVRHGLCKELGFSPEDRRENLRRIGETCKLFLDAGIICLAAFISPLHKDRDAVRQLVGPENFSEIYVRCSLEVCEARDVKGNYKKARAGLIKGYTGISAPYEAPLAPALTIDTSTESLETCLRLLQGYARDKSTLYR